MTYDDLSTCVTCERQFVSAVLFPKMRFCSRKCASGEFAHGDTVQLKSGGLPMMIVEVSGGVALCYYVYEGDVVREWWPVVSLVSVPKPTHL